MSAVAEPIALSAIAQVLAAVSVTGTSPARLARRLAEHPTDPLRGSLTAMEPSYKA